MAHFFANMFIYHLFQQRKYACMCVVTQSGSLLAFIYSFIHKNKFIHLTRIYQELIMY